MPNIKDFSALFDFLYSKSKNFYYGYCLLRSLSKVDIIYSIQSEIASLPASCYFQDLQFFNLPPTLDLQISIPQYFLYRSGSSLLVKALYIGAFHNYTFVGPVPDIWFPILQNYGYSPNKFLCRVLWIFFVLLLYAKGLITGFGFLCRFISKSTSSYPLSSCAHFHNIPPFAIPYNHCSCSSESLVSWFLDFKFLSYSNRKVTFFSPSLDTKKFFSIRFIASNYPFTGPSTFSDSVHFLVWLLKSSHHSFKSFFSGSFISLFLYHELVLLKLSYLHTSNHSPPLYTVFNNSSFAFRPFWSYQLEAVNSNIVFLFYSTNCEVISPSSMPRSVLPSYQLLDWPNIYVWDHYQRNFIITSTRNHVTDISSSINITGPIPLCGNSQELATPRERTLIIFDVSPFSPEYYSLFSFPYDYYTYDTIFRFYHDIFDAVNGLNIHVFYKLKRDISNKFDHRYAPFLSSLSSDFGFSPIPPDASASCLLEQSVSSISFPFTSTGILGSYSNNNAIYYDPLSIFSSNDPIAHGVPIVTGKYSLVSWVKNSFPDF